LLGYLLIAFYLRNHLFMQKELTQCNYLYSKAYVELTLIIEK